jgi:hypothetical protein
MATDITCRDCIHAIWERTPTGRIKQYLCGRCGVEKEILEMYTHRRVPPCITVSQPHKSAIWPHYDARGCTMREVAPKG